MYMMLDLEAKYIFIILCYLAVYLDFVSRALLKVVMCFINCQIKPYFLELSKGLEMYMIKICKDIFI